MNRRSLAVNMTGKTSLPSLSRLWKRLRKFSSFLAFGSLLSTAYAGQLTLSWNDNSDNEEGFKIERSLDGSSFEQIATVAVNVATYTDDTVEDNQSYTYRVRAFNQFGDSGHSNTASGESRPVGDVTIAGFVVTGDTPKRLLVRAMGTELEKSGVSNTLGDPRLKIFQSTSEGSVLISENDDWQEEADIAVEAAIRSGAFGFDEGSKSSAKVIWLDPGLYTAVAESSDSSTGVVLVEVYEVR